MSNVTRDISEKKGCSQEEVIAVLGHELGHWYHGHVWKPMILNQVSVPQLIQFHVLTAFQVVLFS